jgi:uncharacterized protein YjbI with pentapeptide repeats
MRPVTSRHQPRQRAEEPVVPDHLIAIGEGLVTDETELDGVRLSDANLVDREFKSFTVSSSRVDGLRLTSSKIGLFRLTDVVLDRCELAGTILTTASMRRVSFRNCRLSGVVAPELDAKDATFRDCKLRGAWFRMAAFERCEFVNCDMGEADFYTATLAHSRLVRCDLDGVHVSKARFKDVALHGSTLEGIQGAGDLRGVVIGSDQLIALAHPIFAALNITVDDDYFGGDDLPG